jgi:hypothetical protein
VFLSVPSRIPGWFIVPISFACCNGRVRWLDGAVRLEENPIVDTACGSLVINVPVFLYSEKEVAGLLYSFAIGRNRLQLLQLKAVEGESEQVRDSPGRNVDEHPRKITVFPSHFSRLGLCLRSQKPT